MDKKDIKIFMVGHFGARNIGDELILRTQSHLFNEKAKVEILIYSYSTTSNYYKDFPYKHRLIQAFSLKHFSLSLRSTLEAVKYSDIIIVGGGGILQDKYFSYRPLSTLMPALLGFIYNKPVYGYSLGIYHFQHWFNRILLKTFYSNAKRIGIRDNSSLNNTHHYLKTNITPTIHLMPDSALAFPTATVKTDIHEDYIVIVAREVFIEKIKELSILLLDASIKFKTNNFKFICFEDSISENKLFLDLKTQLLRMNDTLSIDIIEFPSIDNYYSFISNAKLIISGRLHGCVSSYTLSKPVLGISYETKVSDFCREHQIPCIDIENLVYDFDEKVFPISMKEFSEEKIALKNYVDEIVKDSNLYQPINFLSKITILLKTFLFGSISLLIYILKKK